MSQFRVASFFCLLALLALPSVSHADLVISVATGDWNRDGSSDAAMIIEPENDGDDNGLKLYIANHPAGRLNLAAYVKNFLWGNTDIGGQAPSLEALSNGSLRVNSENIGIGRNRWEQKLTLAFRDRRFIVAGFTYSYYDTLDLDNKGNCDLNLISGRGELNGQRIRFTAQKTTIEDWDERKALAICQVE